LSDSAAPWKFALQRFMWWDYGVKSGDVVQHSVIPVVGPDKDHLRLSTADASALTAPMTISGQATPNVSAYFNKGIVAAQWMSRALAALGKNPKLAELIADTTRPTTRCATNRAHFCVLRFWRCSTMSRRAAAKFRRRCTNLTIPN
jgi:hypothetical protein